MRTPVRLLIVEDSDDDAELVRLELERGGFDVEWRRVETEETFLEAIEQHEWDLIVSDYNMPRFDGLRAFTLYKQRELDLPFIFVSGALGEERAVEAMRRGARDYILKGSLNRLSAAVARELEEHRTRRRHREAEAARRLEQRRLAVAVEVSGAGVFELSLPDGPGYYSPRWVEILGYSIKELPEPDGFLGWFLSRVHPDEQVRVERAFREFSEGLSERFQCELRCRHADGSWRHLLSLATAAERDEQGQVSHLVGVLLDLTRQRQLEDQLRQAQKLEAVGRLASGIAHDFNNMLSVIMGYADLAQAEVGKGHPAWKHLEAVSSAGERSAELTSQLLAFGRRQVLAPRVFELNKLVEGVERLLTRVIGEDVKVEHRLAPGLRVEVDRSPFEQALLNLAVNARDAMPRGGRLTIATSGVTLQGEQARTLELDPGDYVRVQVIDTGTGMSTETLARLFEPFFTTKPEGKGTGLGLASVHGFVKQSGGSIAVRSALGEGTTFDLYFPAVEESVTPSAPVTASHTLPPSAGPATVLLVEDEELVRAMVSEVLTRDGYRVLAFPDGREALARCQELAARKARLDLLLTDMVLPGPRGEDVARAVRALFPAIKIVFTSGYTPERNPEEFPEALFLPKPVTPHQLLAGVREALRGPTPAP